MVVRILPGFAGHIVKLVAQAQELASAIDPFLPELVVPFGEGRVSGQSRLDVHEPAAGLQMLEDGGKEARAGLPIEMMDGEGRDDKVELPQRRRVPDQFLEALLNETNVRALREPAPGRSQHLRRAIDQRRLQGGGFPEQLISQNPIAAAQIANALCLQARDERAIK